jgi:microcystin-dependent protein
MYNKIRTEADFIGQSGYSGLSGFSGISGVSGRSGYSGLSGYSGVGTSGISGYSGTPVGGYTTYVNPPSATWNIVHNLNYQYPTVSIWDTNRNMVVPSNILAVDANNMTITFSTAIAGRVSLSIGGNNFGTIIGDPGPSGYSGISGYSGFSGFDNTAPVGSVISWTLETPPAGYLECDGSWKLKSVYPTLHSILNGAYGDSGLYFGIPDYRGVFLRGWQNTLAAPAGDPDAASRVGVDTYMTGATITSGNYVGTYQADGIISHTHPIPFVARTSDAGGTTFGSLEASVGEVTSHVNNSDTETRPKNMAVMYCIKYA